MERDYVDLAMETDAFYKYYKAKDILRDFGEGKSHYPFTKALIRIAEIDGIGEDQKKEGMLGIVSQMESFCNNYSGRIFPVFRENISKLVSCARKDIKEGIFYRAISDAESIETNYLFKLQKELSKILVPDVRKLLLRRMTDSMLKMAGMKDCYVVIE